MSILSKISSGIQDFLTTIPKGDIYEFLQRNQWTVIGSLVATYCIYRIATWPRNLPPGPRGWPFIGGLLELSNDMDLDFIRIGKEYKSDIVSVYTGNKLVISLNTADTIKEAFLKSEDFSDRGIFGEVFDLHDQIITQSKYDERWRKLKSFIMSSLRTHGFGTQKSEEHILHQLDCFSAAFKARRGKPYVNQELEELFMKGTTLVLMKMVSGQSYEYDDPELVDLVDRINNYQKIFFEEVFVIMILVNMLPWWLVRLFRRSTLRRSVACASGIRKILQGHVDAHRATLDPNNVRDYLDDCIIEFAKDPGFTDRMLTDTTIAFIPDATETVGTQLLWCIFFLCWAPEYQDKMLEEINRECGANSPGLKDRGKLVLCEAVMLEGMRLSCVAGLSGRHVCRRDVEFRGYFIPKGSCLEANLYAVHNDPKLFPEPEKFKPERFVEDKKLFNTENLMPFGIGRRKCVGEPLTKSQVFLYLTGLVQRFTFNFADGRPATQKGSGVFKKTPACKITFQPR